jgi:HicB family
MTPPKHLGITKDGTPITEELADELAREAEAGYDLSRARRVERRPLAGGTGRSPRLNVRITPGLHAHASERARREGKTLSQLARDALEEYVTK